MTETQRLVVSLFCLVATSAPAAAGPITEISSGVYFTLNLTGLDSSESASGEALFWSDPFMLTFRMGRTTRIEIPPPLESANSFYEFDRGIADFGGGGVVPGIKMRVLSLKGSLTEYGQELLDNPGGFWPQGFFQMELGPGHVPQYVIDGLGLPQHAHVIRGFGDFYIEDVTPLTDQVNYPFESRRGDTDAGGKLTLYIAPEPATLALVGLGMAGALMRRRRAA